MLPERRAEGGMTSGAAMMRFSRGFMRFAGGLPVVPVALRADLGPWRIHTHTLTSGFLANLFWFSFPPRVCLEATVLPPMASAEVGIPNLFWFSFPPRVRLAAAVLPPMPPAEVGALACVQA